MGSLFPGQGAEGAEHAQFLPQCHSQVSQSFLGENWGRISRKANALHNFEEVEVSILCSWEREKMASPSNDAL